MAPKAAIAIDLGTRRTGFAVTDGLRIACQPLEAFAGDPDLDGGAALFAHVDGILDERDVGVFVLGLPLNMDGTESPRSAATRAFATRLAARFPGVALALQDERLTTKVAEDLMREAGERRWQDRRQLKDSMSAVVLLKDWIAAGEPVEPPGPPGSDPQA